MDKKNLMPQAAQPVNRISTGQLPAELAELSEEALQQHNNDAAAVSASFNPKTGSVPPYWMDGKCSYDGDDAE